MNQPIVSSKHPRITIDLAGIGLPEVPRLGIHKIVEAAPPIEPHTHDGMEICYLVSGEQFFHVNGQDYRLTGNDVFWTFPDEFHESGHRFHGKGLIYWMQVRLPRRAKSFLCIHSADSIPLIDALRDLPQRHYVGTKAMKQVFEDAYYAATGPDSDFKRMRTALRIVEWLNLVVDCAGNNPASGPSPDIRDVLTVIDSGEADGFSIGELANLARLSSSHFKAKFRKEIGMPPSEYLNRNRIARAEAMLQSGTYTVTEVAHRLGFSSSQYFATVFKRYTHHCPSSVATKPLR